MISRQSEFRAQSAEKSSGETRETIAVVGIGCRFPGQVTSPVTLWKALMNKVDGIREVPEDRWDVDALYDPEMGRGGKLRVRRGGFLEGIDQFDADFFDFFPAEASLLDPQQRLLLETTYEAFEDAGLTLGQLSGSRTGVFVGTFSYDYHAMGMESIARDRINAYSAMGSGMASIANRLSYVFNLKGPCLMLDTYCSSSLVALHLACQSIWNGDADSAIAGGVNVILKPEFSIALSKAGFLSPDGNCKAFDGKANGYVRSEGSGIVILKPYSQAVADGDLIYAEILSTAVNQDGYVPEGFTVPNQASQVAMLERAYELAGIDPAQVAYIEAHGPGTVVGDPIEAGALGKILGQHDSRKEDLIVGSIKPNLGHMEGASGIAGFIKAALATYFGEVPPNRLFDTPNPNIDFEGLRIRIPVERLPLKKSGGTLYTGVNSFGAGGTNAHAVMKSTAERSVPPTVRTGDARLFVLSARAEKALFDLAGRYADFLERENPDLNDVAWTQFHRRTRHEHQLFVSAYSKEELISKYRAASEGNPPFGAQVIRQEKVQKPCLAFAYSGQGGQWINMGTELMKSEPVFQQAMAEVDGIFEAISGWSIREEITRAELDSRLNDTRIVQPAIMAIQVALTKLLTHYGIKPDFIVGHSIGEVAAAWAAGAIDLNTAASVTYHRARIQDRASGKGRMLAVGITQAQARNVIQGLEDKVSISTINGPATLTLAGDATVLETIMEQLEKQDIFARFVNVQAPYHSHLMEPLKDELVETLDAFSGGDVTLPLYSTVTTQRESGRHLSGHYWFDNVRQPVRFHETVQRMLADGATTFLEIGPHPVLASGIRDAIQEESSPAIVSGLMSRRRPGAEPFWNGASHWLSQNASPTDKNLLPGRRQFVRLPTYAWQRKRHWYELPDDAHRRKGGYKHPLLKYRTKLNGHDMHEIWDARIDLGCHPYLKDHEVDGAVVFPATAHLELARAVADYMHANRTISVRNLRFPSALIVPSDDTPIQARLELDSATNEYVISSRRGSQCDDGPWARHSSGVFDLIEGAAAPVETLASIQARTEDAVREEPDAFYKRRRAAGLNYGPFFQCVKELRIAGDTILARLELKEELLHESGLVHFHPTLLDATVHATFARIHHSEEPDRHYLPDSIERVTWLGKPAREVWSHVQITRFDGAVLAGDCTIYNPDGKVVLKFDQLVCRHVPTTDNPADEVFEGLYCEDWIDISLADADTYSHEPRRLVLIGETDDLNTFGDYFGSRLPEAIMERVDLDDPITFEAPRDARTLIVFIVPDGLEARDDSISPQEIQSSLNRVSGPLIDTFNRATYDLGIPRVAMITRGAERLAGKDDDPAAAGVQSVFRGMMRVARSEFPNVPMMAVDLPAFPDETAMSTLLASLTASNVMQDETEVLIRGDRRYTRQLRELTAESADRMSQKLTTARDADWALLATGDPKRRLEFRQQHVAPLGDHEVCIDVAATGLTAFDLDDALALRSAHQSYAHERVLGRQIAGRVLEAGAQVAHLNAGDEVWAFVDGGCRNRITLDAEMVTRRPEQLSVAEAAGSLIPYLIATESLQRLGQLEAGEHVLVYDLGPAVSNAVVHMARHLGARITVVTDGALEMGDAKDIAVMAVRDFPAWVSHTGAQLCDVIISSSRGAQAEFAARAIRSHGRFVSLATPDRAMTKLLLGQNRSLTLSTLDVTHLLRHKMVLRKALKRLENYFESGHKSGIPVEVYALGNFSEALKSLGRGGSRNQPVVQHVAEELEIRPSRRVPVRSDKAYLITGGASGLGIQIAGWLAERGARHLVLASRGGLKNEQDRAIVDRLTAAGVKVELPRLDVGRGEMVEALMAKLQGHLGGVVHAAGVMDDGTIANMTPERVMFTMMPKAIGAWNLHRATLSEDLDFFVMISSISSMLGMPGTFNYASANRFTETLAEYRQARGLPASALALGVLGDYAGLSRATGENQHMLEHLQNLGFTRMRLDDVLAKLEVTTAVEQTGPRLASRMDWKRYLKSLPQLTRDCRYTHVLSSGAAGAKSDRGMLADRLESMSHEEAMALITEQIRGALAKLLGTTPEEIHVADSLDRYGLDSVTLAQFSTWIQRAIEVDIPLMRLLRGPTINELSQELLERMASIRNLDSGESKSAATDYFDPASVEFVGRWVIRSRREEDAQEADARVICFHSMGVGASLFSHFLLNPSEKTQVCAIQTPGRENREIEPLIENFDELLDELMPVIHDLMDRPTIFWGHSFGGVVGYEVMRRLRKSSGPPPAHLIVTGTAAPDLLRVWQRRDVLLRVMKDGNTPEYLLSLARYLDDPDFVTGILPLMRRDMPLLLSYRYEAQAPLSIPITAFSARQDDVVYRDEIEAWSGHTDADFKLIDVDGDHWFLNRNRDLIQATLDRAVTAIMASTEE